jgi:hypothetical protein
MAFRSPLFRFSGVFTMISDPYVSLQILRWLGDSVGAVGLEKERRKSWKIQAHGRKILWGS